MNKVILTVVAVSAGVLLTQAARGADAKETWQKDCAKCHGTMGKGDTRMGKKLGVKDYTDPKVQAEFTDEQLQKAIKNGVTVGGKEKMKAWGDQFSDQQIKDLVAYIRSLKKG